MSQQVAQHHVGKVLPFQLLYTSHLAGEQITAHLPELAQQVSYLRKHTRHLRLLEHSVRLRHLLLHFPLQPLGTSPSAVVCKHLFHALVGHPVLEQLGVQPLHVVYHVRFLGHLALQLLPPSRVLLFQPLRPQVCVFVYPRLRCGNPRVYVYLPVHREAVSRTLRRPEIIWFVTLQVLCVYLLTLCKSRRVFVLSAVKHLLDRTNYIHQRFTVCTTQIL